MTTKITRLPNLVLALLLVVAIVGPVVIATHKASAATSMAKTFVRFDRMQTSTATTGTVCAQPGTSSSDVKTYTLTLPASYTVSTTAANWQTANISTTNLAWPASAVAWPNAATATAAVVGQTVTWTNASAQTMSTGTMYCFNWTSSAAVSNQGSASATNTGTVTTVDSTSTLINTGSYDTATITNDQIVVTATVPSAFTFTLSANTDSLGNLSSGSVSVSPTPRTAQVDTNAKSGWMVWAKDLNSGLTSATVSTTIPTNCSAGAGTNSTLSAGTAAANTGVTSSQTGGTGTITVATPFVGGSTGKGGGLCSTNLQTLASSTGTAQAAVLTLTNNAAISSLTPAATDYTDTITVVGAGLF